MIINNIFKYIHISKLTYFFILISFFMASFRLVLYIFVLIIIHELGHFLTAKLFNIELDKIYIYPLGGIAKFYIPYNYSRLKELIILINGPLSQELAKNLLIYFFPQHINIITTYHYGILVFNLLPIYPLDGGKLLNILLTYIEPYKKSLKTTITISYIIVLLIFIINLNNIKLNIIIMTLLLIYKIYIENKNIDIKYESFLLERYLNNYKFSKSKIINNYDDFYKNRRHLIKNRGKYTLECDYLKKKYQKS